MIVLIEMKSKWGNYSSFNKTFNDDNHFTNWYRLMNKNGHKIIGVHDINLN